MRLILLFLFVSLTARATDKYPKNADIDVQHYKFDITLSDETDEIKCSATIDILLKKKDIRQVRLDLINADKGKGMTVASVMQNGKKLSYTHLKNELIVTLPNPSQAGDYVQFTVTYSGVPATGLHIKPNKYNEQNIFQRQLARSDPKLAPCGRSRCRESNLRIYCYRPNSLSGCLQRAAAGRNKS
jgi:aminopeptidase N